MAFFSLSAPPQPPFRHQAHTTLSSFKTHRKFPFYNRYLWKILGSGGWLRHSYMLHLFLIFYIWIKCQGPGLGHFQFMPKYQRGDILLWVTQATHQIFTSPFTPFTLQWRVCEFGGIPESYKSLYSEFKFKALERKNESLIESIGNIVYKCQGILNILPSISYGSS